LLEKLKFIHDFKLRIKKTSKNFLSKIFDQSYKNQKLFEGIEFLTTFADQSF